MDEGNASDHSLVLKFLSDLNCTSAEGLEFLEQAEFDQLIGFMKPGVPTRRLVKLLNR